MKALPMPLSGAIAIVISYLAFAYTAAWTGPSIVLLASVVVAVVLRPGLPVPRMMFIPVALVAALLTFSNPPVPAHAATFLIPSAYGVGLFMGVFLLLYLVRSNTEGENLAGTFFGMMLMLVAGSTSDVQPFVSLLVVQGLFLAICLRGYFPPADRDARPRGAGLARSLLAYGLVTALTVGIAFVMHVSERAFNMVLMLADTRGFSYGQRSTLREILDLRSSQRVLLRVTSPSAATYLVGRCYTRYDKGTWDALLPKENLQRLDDAGMAPLLDGASFFSLEGKLSVGSLSARADAASPASAVPKGDFHASPGLVDRIEPAVEFRGSFFMPRVGVALGARVSSAGRDATGVVYLPEDQVYQGEYVVVRGSGLSGTAVGPRATPIADEPSVGLLQIPDAVRAYAGPLAADITAGSTTDLERARTVESYLQTRYKYAFGHRFREADVLHDFLIRHTPAHCELFASSMVLMLRTLGIPSRYVTGFIVEERNETGDYYVVRQEHAHAWVEARLSDSGWMTFDPTPPVGRPQIHPQSGMSQWIDMLYFRVQRIKLWVRSLGWRQMLASLVNGVRRLGQWLIDSPWRLVLLLLVFFGEALFRRADSPGRRWLVRLRGRRQGADRTDPALARLYALLERFDRVVERGGHPRPPMLTLHEFARTLERFPSAGLSSSHGASSHKASMHGASSQEDEARLLAVEFLDAYAGARYGVPRPSAQQVERLDDVCSRLEGIL